MTSLRCTCVPEFSVHLHTCADSVYQAVFPPPPNDLGTRLTPSELMSNFDRSMQLVRSHFNSWHLYLIFSQALQQSPIALLASYNTIGDKQCRGILFVPYINIGDIQWGVH